MVDAFHIAPTLPPDYQANYQAKRFFEISPSRVRDADFGLSTDDWFLAPLTTTMRFAALEALYGKTVPSSGQFMLKKRPKAIPDYVWATDDVPIVTATFKEVVEAMAPGEAEFRPFVMRWPDDEPVAGEWYLMNILNLCRLLRLRADGKTATGADRTAAHISRGSHASRGVGAGPSGPTLSVPAGLYRSAASWIAAHMASAVPFLFRVLHERVARGAEGGRREAAARGAARHARRPDPGDRLGYVGCSCAVIRLEMIFFER
jgi:hypothetical protein